ncbi:MAG: response regulator [Bacteriovoracaceae bacterium]|jgi:CheY-like chemotaxis protein|nr:response regulator [Bacteriovoracaceae bacterium]
MSKVLVADDSQTIQKVINITLSSEPYELIESYDTVSMMEQIKDQQPNLVLLDFNLSEDKTGYDLCRDIKSISPNSNIVYLFGTFDTIDESLIKSSGAVNWIVKPFDGNKFITLCRSLLQSDMMLEQNDFPEVIEDDDWVMDSPKSFDDPTQTIEVDSSKNMLEESMGDWGIEIPSIIDSSLDSSSIEVPGIINSTKEILDEDNDIISKEDDFKYPDESDLELPSNSDLEYPTLELTSASELTIEESYNDVDLDLTAKVDDEAVKNLKMQIASEQDEQDLWKPDDELEELPTKEEVEALNPDNTPDDFPVDVMEESKRNLKVVTDASFDIDKVKADITPKIEAIIKEECEKIARQVAWEVIPDLAENIIRSEIEKIRESVLD